MSSARASSARPGGVVGAQRLLEPEAAQLLVDPAAPERLGEREDLVGVDHQLEVAADHAAHRLRCGRHPPPGSGRRPSS